MTQRQAIFSSLTIALAIAAIGLFVRPAVADEQSGSISSTPNGEYTTRVEVEAFNAVASRGSWAIRTLNADPTSCSDGSGLTYIGRLTNATTNADNTELAFDYTGEVGAWICVRYRATGFGLQWVGPVQLDIRPEADGPGLYSEVSYDGSQLHIWVGDPSLVASFSIGDNGSCDNIAKYEGFGLGGYEYDGQGYVDLVHLHFGNPHADEVCATDTYGNTSRVDVVND